MRENLYDSYGKVIGQIEKYGQKTRLFDSLGKYIGEHDSVTNNVFDNMGKYVGTGITLLGTLIKK